MNRKRVCFVFGHLDVTEAEFAEHYAPRIQEAIDAGARFIVGDARGADTLAQAMLAKHRAPTIVFHMFAGPRANLGSFPTFGGFTSDLARDEAMTDASTEDIGWIRPGREKSGTAKNIARRAGRR